MIAPRPVLRTATALAAALPAALPAALLLTASCGVSPEASEEEENDNPAAVTDGVGQADGGAGTATTEGDTADAAPERDPSPWEPERLEGVADLASLSNLRFDVPTAAPAGGQAPFVGPTVPDQGATPPTGPVGNIAWAEGEGLFDFGDIVQGETRDHTFALANDGEGDLIINEIRPSCGCTKAELFLMTDGERAPYVMGTPIATGTDFELDVTLDSERRQGQMRTSVNVFSNDARQVVALQLSAKVLPVLVVEPAHINFNQIKSSDTVDQTFTVSTALADAFSLEVAADTLPPEISVELTPQDPDENGKSRTWIGHVTLGPDIPDGNRNYPVRLVSDLPIEHEEGEPELAAKTREISMYAIAQVKGVFQADPIWMSFAQLAPGEVKTLSVRVTCDDPEWEFPEPTTTLVGYASPQNPEGVFEHTEVFTAEVRRVPDQNAFDVDLTCEGFPDDMNGTFRGMLEIALDHPKKESLQIPFSGVCRTGVTAPRAPIIPGQTNPAQGTPGGE